jgi:hypothetical protein
MRVCASRICCFRKKVSVSEFCVENIDSPLPKQDNKKKGIERCEDIKD